MHVLIQNFSSEKYCRGLVEGADLKLRRYVCQISGQNNVRSKIQKSLLDFRIKNFVLVVLIGGYCQRISFKEGLVGNRNFNKCAAK